MSPAAIAMGVEVLRSSWRPAATTSARWFAHAQRIHHGRMVILRALNLAPFRPAVTR